MIFPKTITAKVSDSSFDLYKKCNDVRNLLKLIHQEGSHIDLQSSACYAFLSILFSDITGYFLVHQSVQPHPLQLIYILQYLRCPKKDALEDESSIFGQTGISCLSVQIIDFILAGIHGLLFSPAFCGAEI